MTTTKRERHQLRSVGQVFGKGPTWHCVHCEKYFYREPKAFTCKPRKARP